MSDDRGAVVAYDFDVAGGCKESKEVIIKAWMGFGEEYDHTEEEEVYGILWDSPMKGCPSLIESGSDPSEEIYVLVLEKLGPSLEDLCRLMSRSTNNVRLGFDEKMTLALATQMVRGFFPCSQVLMFYFLDKLDRYAGLHTRKVIHNGAIPGNICLASCLSNTSDSSILYIRLSQTMTITNSIVMKNFQGAIILGVHSVVRSVSFFPHHNTY